MSQTLHPIDQEEVMAYLDGELPVERATALAAHLEQCAECTALAADLRLVSQQTTTWQVEPSPQRLTERVTAAIRERPAESPASGAVPTLVVKPERAHPLVRRWFLGLAAATVSVLLIVAISIPNLLRSRIASNSPSQYMEIRPYSATDRDTATHSASSDALRTYRAGTPEESAKVQSPTGPMIVRTAALTVVTKEFDSARAAIERIVREHRGYVAQLGVTGQTGAAHSLTAILRLPVDQLDGAVSELKRLGRVEQESQGGEEVTEQYVDLGARLANARNTEQRLIEVLRERTGKVADILAVEQEIARVRGEIERMTAERKNLENRVSYATLRLQVTEEYKAQIEVAPPSTGTRIHNAMVAGYRGVVDSIVDLTLVLLSHGPSLVFWGLIFFWPARLLWRRLRAMNQ